MKGGNISFYTRSDSSINSIGSSAVAVILVLEILFVVGERYELATCSRILRLVKEYEILFEQDES